MSLGLCAVYAWAVVGASGEGWSGGKVEQLVEGEKTLGEIGWRRWWRWGDQCGGDVTHRDWEFFDLGLKMS